MSKKSSTFVAQLEKNIITIRFCSQKITTNINNKIHAIMKLTDLIAKNCKVLINADYKHCIIGLSDNGEFYVVTYYNKIICTEAKHRFFTSYKSAYNEFMRIANIVLQ